MKLRLLSIPLVLLVSALVNVAVAWGCVAFTAVASLPGKVIDRPSSTDPKRQERICTQRGFGRVRINRCEVSQFHWSEQRGLLSRELAGWPCHSVTCSTSSQVFVYHDAMN